MSDLKDYLRSEQEGYSGTSTCLPKTFVESVGRAAGEARRAQETQARQNRDGVEGAGGSGLSLRGFVSLLALGALLLLLMLPDSFGAKVVVLGVAVVGLIAIPRVRRHLGLGTSIYTGLMIGLLIGCLELILTGRKLGFYNLSTFLYLGVTFGTIGTVVAILRKR